MLAPLDSHFALSDPLSIQYRIKLKQTEPCGPWHGGGQEPYDRWK